VKFIAQQINCMRDLAGTVVEGAPDDIRAVHYVCAMEHTLTPREHRERPAWQLRELAIQGMEQLTS
jgi:predicted lipid-binding transport protein (Tim44 family)